MVDRIKALDVLRGLTTIYMIFFHSYIWFSQMDFALSYTIINYIAMMFSTTYITVSGCAFYFFINKNIEKNVSRKEILNKVAKRASFMILVTIFFQILYYVIRGTSGELFIIHWSLFYDIGLSMLLFSFIPFLRRKFRQIAYLSIFILIFIANHVIFYYNIIVLFFLVTNGTFSYLPWGNFFIIGLFLGDLLKNAPEDNIHKYLLMILLWGVILITVWAIWIQENFYLYAFHFTFGTGVYLVLFTIFFFLLDFKKYNLRLHDRIIQWGRVTFSLYYVHFVILEGLKIAFRLLIVDYSEWHVYSYQFIILVVIFVIIIDLVIRFWYKYEYKYGLEWGMRRFADFSFKIKKDVEKFD